MHKQVMKKNVETTTSLPKPEDQDINLADDVNDEDNKCDSIETDEEECLMDDIRENPEVYFEFVQYPFDVQCMVGDTLQ